MEYPVNPRMEIIDLGVPNPENTPGHPMGKPGERDEKPRTTNGHE
jgi:hypothetical protein